MNKLMTRLGTKRVGLCALFLALSTAFSSFAHAEPLSRTTIIGTWDTKEIIMITAGKAGGDYKVDPGSFVYTFTDDGHWTMQSKKTKHSGKYVLQGSELILKNEDGSIYQDWQADLRSDGTSLLLKTDAMSFALDRSKSNP
jgi:hypothetical protein